MRPFLILGVLALLATWLMWPNQGSVAATNAGTATDPTSTPQEATLELPSPKLTLQRNQVTPPPAEELPQTVAAPEEEIETGTIYGQVVDSLGHQVSEATVLAFIGSKQVAQASLQGNNSQFVLQLPANSTYGLMVDPDSLAHGLIPPLLETRHGLLMAKRLQPNDPYFFVKHQVVVQPGVEHKLDLRVGLPAKASGRILDPLGIPVPKVLVRLTSLERHHGIQSEDSITNELGEFFMPEIFPGDYRLNIYVDPALVPAEADWSIPPPTDMTFAPGQSQNFGDLFLGRGDKTIVGWVVNQDGLPFAGLPILCYSNEPVEEGVPAHRMGSALTRVTTDARGYFELKNVEAIAVKISCTPDYSPGQALGAGKPAMWEYPIELDLSKGPNFIDIGELVVDESRPFTISGNLIFDTAWLQKPEHSKKDLRITISQVKGEELPEGIRRNPINQVRVPIDKKANTFSYKVETPMTAVRLTFSLKGYPDLRFVLHPEPLQSKARNIQIPGDFER